MWPATKQLPLSKQTPWLVDPCGPFGINTAPLPSRSQSQSPQFGIVCQFPFLARPGQHEDRVGVSRARDSIRAVTALQRTDTGSGVVFQSGCPCPVQQECQKVVNDSRCVCQMPKSTACSVPLRSLSLSLLRAGGLFLIRTRMAFVLGLGVTEEAEGKTGHGVVGF